MKQTTETPITTFETTVKGRTYTRYCVTFTPDQGKRKRKTFATLAKARRFAEECDRDAQAREERQKILQRRIGEDDAAKLSAEHLRDAVKALAILSGRGTLEDAARHFVAHKAREAKAVPTVAELIDAYMRESESEGLRSRSLGDLRHRLGKLSDAFGKRRVDKVTRAEAQTWLNGLKRADGKPLAKTTRQHFRFAAGALFSYAVELEYIDENPISSKTKLRRRSGSSQLASTAEIATPAEVQKLLDAAVEHRPEMIAPLALGFFAGIRTAEIRRLDWDRHIRLAKGQIQITGDIAKKRSVRNVDITPNLMQWLALAPVQSGPVAPQTEYGWRNALETVREKAEVARWPHNVMRHSFGSYHLEQFGDPTRTALQMGHRGGDDLLFDHYRQLTTAEDAEKFFAIAPKKEHQVIAFHQGRDPAVNNGA